MQFEGLSHHDGVFAGFLCCGFYISNWILHFFYLLFPLSEQGNINFFINNSEQTDVNHSSIEGFISFDIDSERQLQNDVDCKTHFQNYRVKSKVRVSKRIPQKTQNPTYTTISMLPECHANWHSFDIRAPKQRVILGDCVVVFEFLILFNILHRIYK